LAGIRPASTRGNAGPETRLTRLGQRQKSKDVVQIGTTGVRFRTGADFQNYRRRKIRCTAARVCLVGLACKVPTPWLTPHRPRNRNQRMRELRQSVLACFFLLVPQWAMAQQTALIATWTASAMAADPDPAEPLLKIDGQTVRERARVSVGGSRICIRLTNEYGSTPLLIGSVTVAKPIDLGSVKPGSIHTVTFGGRTSITIPAGAPALSDPVDFPIAPGAEISLSLYFPHRVATPTLHSLALKRAVVSPHGDQTKVERIEGGAITESSVAFSAVLVPAQPAQQLVVAFGDSIVDGDKSTVDADRNWPSDLIRRLGMMPGDPKAAVVNEGIAGNRLLSDGFGTNGLARFERDALAIPGATHIVLLEGINDISFPGAKLSGEYLADPADMRSAEDVIQAYRQLISRAHARGIKLVGATMTPCEGMPLPGYYSESKEALRQTVNKWIRTSGSFDGVIDFDAVLRDPDHPSRILSRFASPDHLHPNDAGYQAMADAIDLGLFR
jgi:lysophospholipase L1-like esterase